MHGVLVDATIAIIYLLGAFIGCWWNARKNRDNVLPFVWPMLAPFLLVAGPFILTYTLGRHYGKKGNRK